MKLTDAEKAILDGSEGKARQKAMELLVHYGEAVGAEKFIATNNVCGDWMTVWSSARVYSLDGLETLALPTDKVFDCQLATFLDPEYRKTQEGTLEFGHVPVKGEHCAWQGSSAVVYINSVLGARSNRESGKSSLAAMLTGRVPYWGLHLPENRMGTHLINVVWAVESVLDWQLLGYYTAQTVMEGIPVFNGIRYTPDIVKLKHLGVAVASASAVGMFHIPNITAEASNLEDAFGGEQPLDVLRFGKAERMLAYDMLNASAQDSVVDLVILGCPHCSMEELKEICRLLEGKKVNSNTRLWIFTPRAIKAMADRNGYTRIISEAGGVLMSDSCQVQEPFIPQGTKVAATNSAKQAQCLTRLLGIQCWFGSTADCIAAAVTGNWRE